jgi:hypothetical protein
MVLPQVLPAKERETMTTVDQHTERGYQVGDYMGLRSIHATLKDARKAFKQLAPRTRGYIRSFTQQTITLTTTKVIQGTTHPKEYL